MAARQPKQRTLSDAAVRRELAASTGLTLEQLAELVEKLSKLMKRELDKKGPGQFNLFGLLKLKAMRKRAQRARKGINPFTGQTVTIAGKPASTRVRARPLKKLKDLFA